MELPVSFADYTRTLLGDEDYKELVTSLESEQSVSDLFHLGFPKRIALEVQA